jgi:hypothetical protein
MKLAAELNPQTFIKNKALNEEALLELAAKFSTDFPPLEIQQQLRTELNTFSAIVRHSNSEDLQRRIPTELELLVYFYEAQNLYPLLFRLLCLVLVLPITSASAERTFSRLKLIKTRLRSSISDEWLADCIFISVEKEIARSFAVEEIAHFYLHEMGVERRILHLKK